MNPKIIRVQGHSTISQTPDLIILAFSINGIDKSYNVSIKNVNKRIEILRSDLESSNIDKKSLKTTHFSINSEYSTHQPTKERIFVGYKCTHNLRLELLFDKKKIGDILDKLAVSMSKSEIRISFDISDKKSFKKEMLEQAVNIAKNNAEILASASGITLGAIQNIEYGWTEVRFRNTLDCELHECSTDLSEIEPQNLIGEDSVTITWEIL